MKDKLKSYIEILIQATVLGAGFMLGSLIIAAVAKLF